MPDADETGELRALQARAYGRVGRLTDAEAVRLQELEGRRIEAPAAPAPVDAVRQDRHPPGRESDPSADAERSGAPVTGPVVARMGVEGEGTASQDGAPVATAPSPWRDVLRRRWKPVVAASALLLLGIGAGWLLFSPEFDGVTLSESETERRLELYADEDFDEGSLRAVARDDDALAWFATKRDGELSCLVLDVGETSQANCVASEEVDAFSLNVSVTIADQDDGGDRAVGGQSVNAYAMLSTTGQPMVALQRWDFESSMLDQFDGDERVRAEELLEAGFHPGLSVVGYFRDEPVWLAERVGEQDEIEKCLIADAAAASVCQLGDTGTQDAIRLEPPATDGSSPVIEVRFSQWGTPYLTITEHPADPDETASGDRLELGIEHGDPIEVTPPRGDEG